MPARIRPKKPVRVYLALWRQHLDLSQERLGLRFKPPVGKGTVSKWEKAKPGALADGLITAYAEALGREHGDMYRRPEDGPSLDAMATGLDAESRKAVADMIVALRRRAG
jgi:hypothetical protein